MQKEMSPSLGPALERTRRWFVQRRSRSRALVDSPRRRLCIGTRNLDKREGDNVNEVDTFSNVDEHPPKLISVIQLIMSWSTTKAQTAGERPHSRAKWFMTGNRANKGIKLNMLVKKSLLNPTHRRTFGKNSPCIVPSSSPKIPRHNPIVAGDIPSPPRRMGVAKKRG